MKQGGANLHEAIQPEKAQRRLAADFLKCRIQGGRSDTRGAAQIGEADALTLGGAHHVLGILEDGLRGQIAVSAAAGDGIGRAVGFGKGKHHVIGERERFAGCKDKAVVLPYLADFPQEQLPQARDFNRIQIQGAPDDRHVLAVHTL